ncbi:hypothetical protein HBDW_10310 [Herbaspirillum sp. DW155]|uniref:hypothetical protein n=1 Tax=Herbaspirillum sp. DW155 TaxID=3095609 RepID=UPI00308A3466|nr:hypothetical protein HBDW_10310 [Herbaspirillum sp. DW155]
MNNKFLTPFLPGILAAVSLLAAATAHAAEEDVNKADPQRWYQEDTSPQARLRNLNQETAAAYAEALKACRSLRGKEAAACRKEAAQARAQDNARAARIYKDYQAAQPAAAAPASPSGHAHRHAKK